MKHGSLAYCVVTLHPWYLNMCYSTGTTHLNGCTKKQFELTLCHHGGEARKLYAVEMRGSKTIRAVKDQQDN
jgi:hypothetical protein